MAGHLLVTEPSYQVLFANGDLSSKLQERTKGLVLTRKSRGFFGHRSVCARLTGS